MGYRYGRETDVDEADEARIRAAVQPLSAWKKKKRKEKLCSVLIIVFFVFPVYTVAANHSLRTAWAAAYMCFTTLEALLQSG